MVVEVRWRDEKMLGVMMNDASVRKYALNGAGSEQLSGRKPMALRALQTRFTAAVCLRDVYWQCGFR